MLIDVDICESCFLERMTNPVILEYMHRGEMGIRYGCEGECLYCGEYGPLVIGLGSSDEEDEDVYEDNEEDDFGYTVEDDDWD